MSNRSTDASPSPSPEHQPRALTPVGAARLPADTASAQPAAPASAVDVTSSWWWPAVPRIAVWTSEEDQAWVARAFGPTAVIVPCPSFAALADALNEGVPAGVLGATVVQPEDERPLTQLVADRPSALLIGIYPNLESARDERLTQQATEGSSRLNRAGIVPLVYPSDPTAHRILVRSLACAQLEDPVQRACVALVLEVLWGEYRTNNVGNRGNDSATEHALRCFFAALFAAKTTSLHDVARELGLSVRVLMRRFARAGLPAPERFLTAARLVRTAWTGERPARGVVASAVCQAPMGASAPEHWEARRLRRLATRALAAKPGQQVGRQVLETYLEALVRPTCIALSTLNLSA